MAQNDEFRIVASLDIPKSVSRIAEDIQKSIVPEINKLDILKLTASLSDDTAKNIQGQLSKLSAQNMTINIGANVSNTQAQMSQIKNQVQSQLTDIQGVVNNSAINIASAINNAINTSTKSFSIDSSITQQMTDYFMKTFDLMEQSKDGTVVVKNEVESLMKQLASVFTTGDTKRIEEYQTQLLKLAETYGKLSTNMEAVQRLELIRSSYDGIGGNINPYYKAEYADAFGSADLARQTFNEVFGIGKWNWNKNAREINGNYLQSDPLGIADSSITDQLITYCNAIIEAKSQLKQKVVDSLSDEQLSYIFQELQNISGIKFPDPSQFTRQMETLKASVKDAYGNIKISYPTYDELAKVYGSDTVNAFMDSLAGSSKQWQIVENSTNATIKSVEQYNSILSQSQAIQKAYDNELKSYSTNVTQQMGDVTTSASTVEKAVTQVQNATAQTVSSLSPIQTQYKTTFENIANVVKVAEDEFRRFGEVSSVSNKPAITENGIEYYKDFTIQVKAATGEVQKFKYEMQTDERTGNIFYQLQNINEADAGIQKLIISQQKYNDKLKALQTSYLSDLHSIRSAWEDINGGKSVKNNENIENLKKQYFDVLRAIRDLKNADETTMSSMRANVTTQIDKLNQMVTQYHNAEKVATQLRAKGFETVKTDTGNNIDKFINSINNSQVPIRAMKTEIDNLTSSFANLDTIEGQAAKSSALTNILNMFDNAKTKFQSLKELFKGFGSTDWFTINADQIRNIEDVNTKVAIYQTFLQQTADEWKSQGLYIGEVKKQMSSMLNHIGQIKNAAKLQEYVSTFDKLSANVLRLKVNLDAQVESQNKIYLLQTQIAKLSVNDVTNKSYLTQQLADEEKHLQNLQMQSATLKNIVSIAEQETIVYERTAKAREQMVLATNHQADTQMAKNIEQVDKYATSIENAIKRLNSLKTNNIFTNNADKVDVQNQISQINQLITKFTEAQTTINGMKSTGTIDNTQFANLTSVMTDLDTKFREVTSSANALQTQLKQTNGQEAQSGKIKVLISQLEAFAVANSKAMKSNKLLSSGKTVSQEWNAMMSQLKAGADPTVTRQIANNFRVVRNEVKALGLEGSTTFQNLWASVQKFSRWMGITMVTASIAREIRGLFTDVAELDTALVDLRKTFKGTSEDLEEFYYDANDIAKQLGVTTKEVINQASAWSRLGFSTKEAAIEMSKMSSIFASISPDMDTEKATDGLLSIIKAFDIDVNDVLDGVISKVNKVGNEFGTSNGEVVNMLTRSSSAMKEANNTLEETIALETAAVEITRDAESVGTAYKTLSMRLRGYDETTEEYSNDVEVLSGKIADLTKTASTPGGISLFTDETKTTYKSTVQLLREISAIYDDLSDKTQAELLEVIAGKRQGQIIAATLNNWETVEKALTAMSNANGSAMQEMEVIMDSVDYKANKLKETFLGLGQDAISRDFLKSILDSATRLLETVSDTSSPLGVILNSVSGIADIVSNIVKNIGLIPTIFAGLSLKNVGEQNKHARFCTATYNKYRECNTFQNKVVKLLGNAKALQPLIA